MKQIRILFLTFVIFICSGAFNSINIHAQENEYYPFNCSEQYEVSSINNDGSFNKVACFVDFNSANAKMKEMGEDYVVRSATSLSPTKIVSMNSGIAYSYPGRSNDITMNIYEDPSDRTIYTKRTYITNHYEMTYHGTEIMLSNGKYGMIKVTMNGFEGYADLENSDLVPMKYIREGIAIYLGGNNTYEDESAFKVVPRQNYFIAEQNGNYTDLKYVMYRAYPQKNSLEPIEASFAIGVAPSFMELNKKYYSSNGVDFFADSNMSQFVGTYYNYYQFLPLRSKTNITAPQFEAFLRSRSDYNDSVMKDQAQVFIDAQNEYGVNALLVYALACHESACGTSNLAVQRNNLFGWNAYDSDPNQASYFSSVKQAVEEHMGINLRGYLDITDGRFFSSSIGNKGSGLNVKYASDPYWGMKIAQYAYRIDKYANNHNGKLSDYNQYDLALINAFDIEVKSGAGSSSKTLYKTGYGGSYQKDFIVITLDEVDSYTKIQSTNAIDENGNIKTHRTPITTGDLNPISTYDFDLSVAYVESRFLLPLNYEMGIVPTGKYEYALEALNWHEDKLAFEGYSYVPGVLVNDDNKVQVTLEFINGETYFSFDLKYDVLEEDKVYFKDAVDLSLLENGTYLMKINTAYSRWDEKNGFELKDISLPTSKILNDRLYAFSLKNGLLELKITDYVEEEVVLLRSIDKLIFKDMTFSIDGIGAIASVDHSDLNQIKHQIIFKNIEDDALTYTFDATSKDSNGFTINDGFDYKYTAYHFETDLSHIEKGSYSIYLRITNGDLIKEEPLMTSNRNYALNVLKKDKTTYKLSTNELYGYRLELDIFDTDLDYAKINKPSSRSSLISFDTINYDENGILNIDFLAMMYYLNYNEITNPKYEFYFASDKGDLYKADDVKKVACPVDYKTILDSSYDLSGICYEAKMDTSKMALGNYHLLVAITNGEYYDLIEMTNRSNRQIEGLVLNQKSYAFNTSAIRKRIELNISEE